MARGSFSSYLDPLTETVVTLLTPLANSAILPDAQNRFIGSRERTLLCACDVGGTLAPVRIDLRAGVIAQFASAATNLKPRSLQLDATEKTALFLDGDKLTELNLATRRSRVLLDRVQSFTGTLVVRGNQMTDLRGTAKCPDVVRVLSISPDRTACLAERSGKDGSGLWWVPLVDAAARPRLLLEHAPAQAYWSADGENILFLREFNIIRQNVHTNKEEAVVKTTSFAVFSPNRDGSIYVGASASKAQPVVTIMTASGTSELALCEHRATDASAVMPVFSPDSRRIYFQSDRLGKPAVYSVNTETLVEPT